MSSLVENPSATDEPTMKLLPKTKGSRVIDTSTNVKSRAEKIKEVGISKKSKKTEGNPDPKTMVNKNTRPLNSYMAFRSFYSKIFEGLQQKEISGLVALIWDCDPFKAKWALLAKAYSMIRDVKGKSATSLEKFLEINAPYVGLASPKSYLMTLGWHIAFKEDGGAVVRRSADIDLNSFNHTTNISVDDIIDNCYRNGFVTGNRSDIALSHVEPVMTMATTDQSARSTKSPPSVGHQDVDLDLVEGTSKTATHQCGDMNHIVDGRVKENGNYQIGAENMNDTSPGYVVDHNTARANEETSSSLSSDHPVNVDVVATYPNNFSAYANSSLSGKLFCLAPERLENKDTDFDLQFAPGNEYDIFDPFGGNLFEPLNISFDIGEDFGIDFDAFLDNLDSEN